jgi:prolyl-tRNA synthetase
MTHSDDNGLVLPPKLAPAHVVILPIIHKEADRASILSYCENLIDELKKIHYHGRNLRIELDTRDLPGGEKAWSWVKKGVPIRLEIGNKECATNSVFMGRRDKDYKDRKIVPKEEFLSFVKAELDDIQAHLFLRAQEFRQKNTVTILNKDDFYQFYKGENEGGFALANWNGSAEIEAKIKQDLGVTIRCIPFENGSSQGKCIFSGEPSKYQAVFAKAY